MIRGLKHLPCTERLRELELISSSAEEKAPRRPWSGLPVPEGPYRKAGEGLFIRAGSDRTRGNGFKLEKGRFRLHIRKKFFTVGMGRHWNRLSSKVVNASSLQAFKARLDRTFEQPDLEGGIPAYSLGLKLAHLKGLFHSIPFYDSIL